MISKIILNRFKELVFKDNPDTYKIRLNISFDSTCWAISPPQRDAAFTLSNSSRGKKFSKKCHRITTERSRVSATLPTRFMTNLYFFLAFSIRRSFRISLSPSLPLSFSILTNVIHYIICKVKDLFFFIPLFIRLTFLFVNRISSTNLLATVTMPCQFILKRSIVAAYITLNEKKCDFT